MQGGVNFDTSFILFKSTIFEIVPYPLCIVVYSTKLQKKHFVGEVLSTGNLDPERSAVCFLRKVPGSQNVFQLLELCDENRNVPFSDVISVLDKPKLERRGLLHLGTSLMG